MKAPELRKTTYGWEVIYPDGRYQAFSDKRSAKAAIKAWNAVKS